MRMAAIGNRIAALLYPSGAVCIACGALRVDDPTWELCDDCARSLRPLEPPFCPRCGAPGWAMLCSDCQTRRPDALDARAAAFVYEGTARALVRALKYHSVLSAAEVLADAMMGAFPDAEIDALVPVPLHARRRKIRGYNQAEALCRALSRRNGMPVLSALTRTRATRTQTRLSQQARRDNVNGAFEVCRNVRGLSLLLVDDVLTTGATAVACADALKRAEAHRVFLLTAARAGIDADS